ncbi:MAG TPA: RnfABCDGE type electron transport complex subunit D [Candidatus Pristimantibacillus sp.]|nr:RnfABCDGE type electron transport complex subunit D [Candidatus Pristimantibacillus sp.]
MVRWIDYFLDRITMYRLLLYYLIALLLIAVGLSWAGVLPYHPEDIIFSASILTLVCMVTNEVFARTYKAPTNFESAYITALILALIITPKINGDQIMFYAAAGGLAMASKYMLAIHKRHIFNPAAIAVALTAFGFGQSASWWIGTVSMLPYVVIGGLLIVRKVRRFTMIISFMAAVWVSTIVVSLAGHHDVLANLQKTALHSSIWFLAFVMLTEPLTSPATKAKQMWYGFIVGAIFPPQFHIGTQYSTPELSLLVGNVFAFATGFRRRLTPKFLRKEEIAPDIADFVFRPEKSINYKPGQYMEWTLPHNKSDSRGVRRYFTLASSPTEGTLRIGVRFYPNGSSFKRAMQSMDGSTPVAVGDLGGDFVLPADRSKKLAFIAGGIGVTPYRSMVKYLIDTKDSRAITLLYSEVSAEELAYTNIFDQAERELGLKTVYTLTGPKMPSNWAGRTGFINAEMIAKEVPDYRERIFYISGSHTMVMAMQAALKSLGVPRTHVKTDFFPGYA